MKIKTTTRRVWRILDGEKCKVQIQFETGDLWVGVFWRRSDLCLHLYVCIVPMFPLHIAITRQRWIEEWARRKRAELNPADYECQYVTPGE